MDSHPLEGKLLEVMAGTSTSNLSSLFLCIWQIGDTLLILQRISPDESPELRRLSFHSTKQTSHPVCQQLPVPRGTPALPQVPFTAGLNHPAAAPSAVYTTHDQCPSGWRAEKGQQGQV